MSSEKKEAVCPSAIEIHVVPTAPGDSIGKGLLVAPKMQQSVQLINIVLQFEESDDKIAIFSRYSIRTEELREIIVVGQGGEGACKANWLQGCEWDVTHIRSRQWGLEWLMHRI